MTAARPRTSGGKLAINRLKSAKPLDAEAVEKFLARHEVPVVEGEKCTFLWRGEADEAWVCQRIVGLPDRIPMRRLHGTDLWYLVLELPEGSRVEYQIELRRGEHYERFNDPLNEKRSHSPMGSSSVCFGAGYETPDWVLPDPDARPGELRDLVLHSKALGRDAHVTLYLPARFRPTTSYPLLVVHDGGDFLQYASMKTVLDNLIHRVEVADLIVAFTYPEKRLVEYADHEPHARFLSEELVPALAERWPLADAPASRCLMGASFGAVASLSAARRYPAMYGRLLLQSGSFAFSDIGPNPRGPSFAPVVKFMNEFRDRPVRVSERVFVSCGQYESLIYENRSLVPLLQSTGMEVRFVEARDGHNWENWRDRMRAGLSWLFPGPVGMIYE